jgi:DNA-binding NarL/FixJ family response regulator
VTDLHTNRIRSLYVEEDPGVRTIVSSGYSHDPVLAEYEHDGFRGVVPKPSTLSGLPEAVERALRR